MNEQRPGFLVRMVRGLWRGLDLTRRVVLNLLFLIVLLLFLGALAGDVPRLEPKTALVIAPRGALVEQYTIEPTQRALARLTGEELEETQLRDVLFALEHAATDANIERVVIVPDELASAGTAIVREVAAALQRFRKSGKEVIAYGDAFDQRGYLLAAQADKVYLHPEGGVLLAGLSRYRTYYKDAFDKLGVEARLFRVGEYKSAGETFVRSDQSPEARDADLYWLNDVWQRYLEEIATARKLDARKLAQSIDDSVNEVTQAGGDLAQVALRQGLVDELKTRDQVRSLLMSKGAEDAGNHTFRHVDLDDYVTRARASEISVGGAEVAIVVAQGEIVSGDQPSGTVGGESTSKLIRQAREDDDVKALVLRVDSPGGEVFPSELIRREVELTKQAGKPVIVSMGNLAASGGYWIAMNGDQIIANPSTISGSIGIYGLWFNVPQTMEKLGLRTDGVGTTWLAGAFDPTRPFDPRAGELIQSVINRGYAQFVSRVAQARGKTPEEINTVARGRVWTGAQALERGLVDRLGLLPDAIEEAARRADLGASYRVRYIEKDLSTFEQFAMSMSRSAVVAALQAVGAGLPTAWLPARTRDDLAMVRRLAEQTTTRKPVVLFAHCECGVQ